MDKMEEMVFCVSREDLQTLLGDFKTGELLQGYIARYELQNLLNLPQNFIPRRLAENDPGYKQIIPYQLFCFEGRYFVYQRGGGVSEGRLAGRLSVGVGGHINIDDSSTGNSISLSDYQSALFREQHEEREIEREIASSFIGFINEEDSPVGQVHLGTVHLGRLGSSEQQERLKLRRGAEDIHPVAWWSAGQIRERAEQFERWALLAVELAESCRSNPV